MNRLVNFLRTCVGGAATLSPDCRRASRLQAESLHHPLPRLESLGLRLHLALCRWCRRYGKQLRFLSRARHEHLQGPPTTAAPTLTPNARERMKRRLRAERERNRS
jgi:hypothetical protein